MTVYVDDMRARLGRLVLCHMLGDSVEELHAMADRIGVSRRWYQPPTLTVTGHYDIALSKRALAIAAGAIEISRRQAGAMNLRLRITGTLGPPEQAIMWAKRHLADQRLRRGQDPQA